MVFEDLKYCTRQARTPCVQDHPELSSETCLKTKISHLILSFIDSTDGPNSGIIAPYKVDKDCSHNLYCLVSGGKN